jgi:hypothetical protein
MPGKPADGVLGEDLPQHGLRQGERRLDAREEVPLAVVGGQQGGLDS